MHTNLPDYTEKLSRGLQSSGEFNISILIILQIFLRVFGNFSTMVSEA
jgi:hypothetical protein